MTTVDVVLPLCNDGPEVGATLVGIADYFALHANAYQFDFIIVDDASGDQTRQIAFAFAKHRHNVTVLSHDKRYGIARALRTAFDKASADYTVVIDVRMPRAAYVGMQLVEALDADGSDIAIMSKKVVEPHRILARARARCELFTSMVRAYRTAFLKSLSFNCRGTAANAELLLTAIRKGAGIVEIAADTSPEARVSRRSAILFLLARQFWACPTHFRSVHFQNARRG